MAAYSFLNVMAAIAGPGGAFSLGSGSANAEEGIKTAMIEEKDLLTVGADGGLMHTLRASNAGKIIVSLLKTSPVNNQLSLMYNFQNGNPAAWGSNTLTVSDVVRGDVLTGTQMAFLKQPDVVWAKDGNVNEWEFVGNINELLGAGVPDVNV